LTTLTETRIEVNFVFSDCVVPTPDAMMSDARCASATTPGRDIPAPRMEARPVRSGLCGVGDGLEKVTLYGLEYRQQGFVQFRLKHNKPAPYPEKPTHQARF
jgi:hypothetical protein